MNLLKEIERRKIIYEVATQIISTAQEHQQFNSPNYFLLAIQSLTEEYGYKYTSEADNCSLSTKYTFYSPNIDQETVNKFTYYQYILSMGYGLKPDQKKEYQTLKTKNITPIGELHEITDHLGVDINPCPVILIGYPETTEDLNWLITNNYTIHLKDLAMKTLDTDYNYKEEFKLEELIEYMKEQLTITTD